MFVFLSDNQGAVKFSGLIPGESVLRQKVRTVIGCCRHTHKPTNLDLTFLEIKLQFLHEICHI